MIRVPIQVGGSAKCVLVGDFECGVHVIKTYHIGLIDDFRKTQLNIYWI